MKTTRFNRIFKQHIQPAFPGYTLKGRIFYREPLTSILCGYFFKSLIGSDSMKVLAFVQPLYVPAEGLVAAFGRDFWWQAPIEDVDGAEGLSTWDKLTCEVTYEELVSRMTYWRSRIERLCDPHALATDEVVTPKTENGRDEYYWERCAYSLIMAGDYRGGMERINALREYVRNRMLRSSPPSWLPTVDERAAVVQSALRQDPHQALAVLNRWVEEMKDLLELS